MLHVRGLIWDDWNVRHIARHGVTPGDVVEVCRTRHIVRETYAGRLIVIGTNSSGDVLTVILSPQRADIYYPITARPASRKERRAYREEVEPHGHETEGERPDNPGN